MFHLSGLLPMSTRLILSNRFRLVQRSFTRCLPGFKNLSYVERLSLTRLQIPSLEHRRLMTDLITCFNNVHGFTSLEFEYFFKFSPAGFNTSGHHLRLIIPLTKTNTHIFYFSSPVVLTWNVLPEDVVSAPSTISFKEKLSKIDLSFSNFHVFYEPRHILFHIICL